MLQHALAYAARGWRIFPVHTTISGQCSCGRDCGKDAGKHPRIKAWQKHATTDPATIDGWWRKWAQANIGLATGGNLIVLDLDGAEEIARFAGVSQGRMPATLTAQTGRGFHLYLNGALGGSKKVGGLLVRGEGGYVVAPPSWHASGKPYQWVSDDPCADAPSWFMEWAQSAQHTKVMAAGTASALVAGLPDHLRQRKQQGQEPIAKAASAGLTPAPQSPTEIRRITSALASIPADCPRDTWLHCGMALHSCGWIRETDGADLGFALWAAWSETGKEKYQGTFDLETRWRSFGKGSGIGLGTLYHIAEQHGWSPPLPPETAPAGMSAVGLGHYANGHANGAALQFTAPNNETPLIELNQKYACIGDLGGKCLVMGWVPSKVDIANEIPSFQTFKAFAERFGHRYLEIPSDKEGETVSKQLGSYWLKWTGRRSFDGIDMDPSGQCGDKVYNLWRGFAVKPIPPDGRDGLSQSPARWDRMKEHMAEVLAGGDQACFEYIVRWSAWAVQHPGERAESALVFRGAKGTGKGTFAHAMRRLFGAHGLHIANSKHLVGSFNAHLRNCLLLYADEAFWAGDKQGESTLKALITEPTLTIEQKGVDAVQWHNRIHLIMTANAEWVVPASREERRYVVLDVGDNRMGDRSYFGKLHHEINSGGLGAMLHELQNLPLGDWHPRDIIKTKGLTAQKMQSMKPMEEWWENVLQEGVIPAAPKDSPDTSMANYLLHHMRDFSPRLDVNPTRLGLFLKDHGCIKLRKANGNAWRFPTLQQAREGWAKRYSGWSWNFEIGEWSVRS